MKRIVLSLAIIAALWAPILQAQEKLKILSTIKPIHSLVAAIAGDFGESELIIPSYGSPHHYSLKPSDIRKINDADLIFRVDPKLESFLLKSLRSVSEAKVITLTEADDLTLLTANGNHTLDHAEGDPNHETDEPVALDYHLWLSPDNSITMAQLILDVFSKIDPENKDTFTENTKQLIESIRKKDREIKQLLEEVATTAFLVTHDAWQYFTHHYKLKQVGSVSEQEHLRPSAKAISEARATIVDSNVKCLVTEPSLKKKTIRILAEDLSVNITEIDPLGRDIPESSFAYPQLLQYTADKLLNCLKNK